jgi:predicted deacylase
MTNPIFEIGGQRIDLGQRKTVLLPMPKLYDCTPLSMPVHVFRGKQSGPCLCVTAAIHGDEVNGIEIARRLIKKNILKKIQGTLIVVPIVNVYGFIYQNRYLMDRRDLNRAFPGTKKGSLASRLAYLITHELISKATHCIDLHAGSLQRTNLPHIRADLEMKGIESLAQSFNSPVILHAKLRDGSMRQYADDKDIPFLLYEAGESLRFDELSIRTGVNGIINVMDNLGMISLKQKHHSKIKSITAKHSYWVRAPESGLFHPYKQLGKLIKKGECIARISNPMGREEYRVYSPLEGIIIGKSNMPMIHEGAAIFHVASFDEVGEVVEQIDYLKETYID